MMRWQMEALSYARSGVQGLGELVKALKELAAAMRVLAEANDRLADAHGDHVKSLDRLTASNDKLGAHIEASDAIMMASVKAAES